MHKIPINCKNANLEILTKLLNSVAKRYGCQVEYIAEDNRLKFNGDMECCRHVTEETLAFFPKSAGQNEFPLNCAIDANGDGKDLDPP